MKTGTCQTFPELSLPAVFSGQFMRQYDSYTADQFLFRDQWVSLATGELLAIGKRDNQKTYFGKDGYLFAIDTIDYQQMEKNQNLLQEFLQKAKQENPELRSTVMIVPTSSAVLSDKLPYGAPVVQEAPLIASIGRSVEGLASFCDPTQALLAHAGEENLLPYGSSLDFARRLLCLYGMGGYAGASRTWFDGIPCPYCVGFFFRDNLF